MINPGSTSTKLALFEDDTMIWQSGAHHPLSELNRFNSISEQYPYRMEFIKKRLADSDIEIRFDAVIGRGGLTKPLKGGVYRVNDKMIDDLKNAKDQHACNLGAIMAKQLALVIHLVILVGLEILIQVLALEITEIIQALIQVLILLEIQPSELEIQINHLLHRLEEPSQIIQIQTQHLI